MANPWERAGQTLIGAGLGGSTPLGAVGAVAGGAQGSSGWIDKNNPYVQGPRDARKAKKESEVAAEELYGKTQGLNKILNEADTTYGDQFKSRSGDYLQNAEGLVKDYTAKIGQISNQAQSQATDAKATYTNSILPEFQHATSLAKNNADAAMTLKQASDPNNPIMKAIRALYNQQGQAANKQGQQDFGVLSSLGAQAAGQQFGAAGPMTAGQMGQIYSANQSQAGDAYARAQQRMHDLQQQGLDRSFDQSNQLYQYGQDAQGRYSGSIKDLEQGNNNMNAEQGRFRGEIGGYEGDMFGTKAAFNSDKFNVGMMGDDIAKGNAYAGTGREQSALDQRYGAKQQGITNEAAAKAAANAGKGQFISALLGSGAKLLGGAAA